MKQSYKVKNIKAVITISQQQLSNTTDTRSDYTKIIEYVYKFIRASYN